MDIKSKSEKELTRYLMPILKRNFLEWQSLKRKIYSRGKVKDTNPNEYKIKKVLLSEPVAAFYAHWLKTADHEGDYRELQEKITCYIRGLFAKDPENESFITMLFTKCDLIAYIHHKLTLKIIESALALQDLTGKESLSFKNIFENEKTFKIVLKSSVSVEEWRLYVTALLSWSARLEISREDLTNFYHFSQKIVAKREKELFS